ncbi:interleukin-13 isoform X2 [Erinaceus europaeus]|uniref:Interleukin-13 n=1 Tax=Erinaceus europaeus TaxID=9365 RepID=A0ABM3X0Q4_ERIEU|nr:interleukin-13 isoform X2 [Erinaceus europaeus]
MALWLTVIIALTCLGGLTSPSYVPTCEAYKEFIRELSNITQNHKANLCNGSMVWSINLTAGVQYCAALESLMKVSNCSAIRRTQRMLLTFCPHKHITRVSSAIIQDTKIEVFQFAKDLLNHLRKMYRQKTEKTDTVCIE